MGRGAVTWLVDRYPIMCYQSASLANLIANGEQIKALNYLTYIS